MSKSHYYDIKLQDAMTMEVEKKARAWSVSGLQVEWENKLQDVIVENTMVLNYSNGKKLGLWADCRVEGELSTSMYKIDEVSSLEELRNKYPNLFELKGYFYNF